MMTAEQLKASILQMAMQGKLVEQRAEEGTGTEFFAQVCEEKQTRIKAGRIKTSKSCAAIIENEIPFDIPSTWKWIRFEEVISLLSGADLTPDKYNALEKGTVYLTGASNIENGNIIINRWTEFPKNVAHKGDLLLTCKGTVGKTAILGLEEVHIARQIMAITPILCDVKYIDFFLQYIVESLKKKAKSMIPGIERSTVLNALFPLPPLEEQKRIVAKLEELMPFVAQYAKASTRLNTLNASFPDQMKKSILQQAVMGKLVPQDPNDEPASVLLKRIREVLPKHKPCKDDLNFDSMNFDIPETWEWAELNELFDFVDYRGKTPHKIDQGVFLITASNIRQGFMEYTRKEYISEEEYLDRQSRGITHKGDLLFTTEAPMGNAAICDLDRCSCGQRIITLQPFCEQTLVPELYMYFILSPAFQMELLANCTGTTAKGIKADKLKHFKISLPPYAEQKRIVQKLQEVIPATSILYAK